MSTSAVGAQDLMFASAVLTTSADPGTPLAAFMRIGSEGMSAAL